MIESMGHTPELRECVRLLNEATLLVRIDISDLLVPLFSCRDALAANRAPGADAVRRWISMVQAAQAVARTKGPGADMVLARLSQVEAILVQTRGEQTVARSRGHVRDVLGLQE